MLDVQYPTRGGFVDWPRAGDALREAAVLWLVPNLHLYEGDTRLPLGRISAIRASLPSDLSFASYDQAVAHVTAGSLPEGAELPWNQALLDLILEYPIGSDRSDFAIHADFDRLGIRVATALRFVSPDGPVRAFQLAGDQGLVRLDPRWHQAARNFIGLGFVHILEGTDHLLFLLCVVIPLRRVRTLLVVITAFTVAHSITLIAAASGFGPSGLWFPPLIETLIALSIVYIAIENMFGPRMNHRWLITFAFGLVHGFGFSFLLRDTMQFAGSHLLTSLVSFNLGVELGQLFVLALAAPALWIIRRHVLSERTCTLLLSIIVAHTSWHWMTERAGALSQFPWQLPAFDAAFMATASGWLMGALILGGLGWLATTLGRRRPAAHTAEPLAAKE